ncbi:right-handed parallel beta-helix repeat-containing protein, partial [Candidatus Sumerlaeota bacterium]|nr:right-handed parallel beta-helix repeat-containing protein [Candidatus Sumerlaeota bacterium]
MRKTILLIPFFLLLAMNSLAAQDPPAPQITLNDAVSEPGTQVVLIATIEGEYDEGGITWYTTTDNGSWSSINDFIQVYMSNTNACNSSRIVQDTITLKVTYDNGNQSVEKTATVYTVDVLPPTISKCETFCDVDNNHFGNDRPVTLIDENQVPWVFYRYYDNFPRSGIRAKYYNSGWTEAIIKNSAQDTSFAPYDAISIEESGNKYIYLAICEMLSGSAFDVHFLRFNITDGVGSYSTGSWENLDSSFPPFSGYIYNLQMLYNGSNFYVAYTKTESSLDNVYYRKLEGSSWTEESLLADDVYDENRNYWTLAQDGQIWAIFTRYIQGTDDSQDVYARQYVGGQWQDEELWTDDHPTNIWPIDYASSIVSDTSGQVWGAYRKYTYSGDFPYHMKAKVIRRSINSTDKTETDLSLDSEGKASWAGPVLGVNSTGDKIYGIYGRVVTTAVEQTKEVESEDLLMKLQSAGSTTYWQDGPYRLTCSSMLKDTLSISRRFSPDGVVAIWNYRQDDNAVTYGNLTTHRHKASIEIADDGNPSDMLITLNIDIADPNEAQIYIAGDVIDDEQTFQWITIPPNSKIENIELNGLDGLKKIKAKFKDKFGNESPFYEIQYDLRLANPQVVNSTSDLRYKEGVYYFNSGNTYLINTPLVFNDSSFSVDSFAHKVVLEAGSIIKFGANAYIEIANDSSIDCIVAGEQYNYVLFTSAFDDSVGMDTDGIPSGDYENAILYRGKGDCLIEHAKFRYADTGIVIYNSTPDGESSNIEIRNSIFRDCKTGGVFLGSHPAYDSGTPTQVKNADIKVINNLFVDIAESLPRVGVTVNNSNANITIQNNTFHNIYTGDSNEGVCIY